MFAIQRRLDATAPDPTTTVSTISAATATAVGVSQSSKNINKKKNQEADSYVVETQNVVRRISVQNDTQAMAADYGPVRIGFGQWADRFRLTSGCRKFKMHQIRHSTVERRE